MGYRDYFPLLSTMAEHWYDYRAFPNVVPNPMRETCHILWSSATLKGSPFGGCSIGMFGDL